MRYSDILSSSPYESDNGSDPCNPVQKAKPLRIEVEDAKPIKQPIQPMPFQPMPPIQPIQPIQPQPPFQPVTPVFPSQEGPPPVMRADYIPGFLRANIGKYVRAEFIIGDNQFVDKAGIIVEVGVNYFVLQDINFRNYVMCDLYSVKFITFLGSQ